MSPLLPPKKPWQQDDRRELHKQWCEEVINNGVNLSVWEEEFIESIASQLDAGKYLSEKQAEILERIYSEKTP